LRIRTRRANISAAVALVNHGPIYGDVAAGGNATLTNTGVIHRNVEARRARHFHRWRRHRRGHGFDQNVLAFSGNFGNVTIDKFVAGGTTHDVISFASND
jgi:hypothetical protein